MTRALRDEADWVVVVCAAYLHPDVPHPLPAGGAAPGGGVHRVPLRRPGAGEGGAPVRRVFTNERTSVPRLREANPETHYLPMGYDPAAARARR